MDGRQGPIVSQNSSIVVLSWKFRSPEDVRNIKSIPTNEWKYLPVLGREDWIALLDQSGMIRGFLKGDGF
jgi:hypothetical protein